MNNQSWGIGEEEEADELEECPQSTPMCGEHGTMATPIRASPWRHPQGAAGTPPPLEVEACRPLHHRKRSKPSPPTPAKVWRPQGNIRH